MQVIVNGRKIDVAPEDRITYAAIAGLAGHPNSGELSVTYHWKGHGDLRRSGILAPGESVELADGMQFSACHTGNA